MKGKKEEVLYRSIKFEIFPNQLQSQALGIVVQNLRLIWNWAVGQRQDVHEKYLKPIYDAMALEKKEDAQPENSAMLGMLNKKAKDFGVAVRFIPKSEEFKIKLREAQKEHSITLFDQINALTPMRKGNCAHASIPRNWQEETLDTVNAGFVSFMALRKKGDPDARPPRLRDQDNYFYEIPGRSGFKIQEGNLILRCSCFEGGEYTFQIPEYQQTQIATWERVKKFTLFRDQKDSAKPGRFWISLAGEMQKPETQEPTGVTFLAVGATLIGVVAPSQEYVVHLWRPDKHWKPKIEVVEERMKRCARGSQKHERLAAARRRMFQIMQQQQKQNHREVVSKLLQDGIHFVVPDLVIRSKPGKLADSSNLERGGSLGANWAAQNTGGIGELIAHLEDKVREFGGSVQRCKPAHGLPSGNGDEHKLAVARCLKEEYLSK